MPLATSGLEPLCKVQLPVGEYQKGCDNTVADVLSQVTIHLDPDMVRLILNGLTLGAEHWAEVHDLACNRRWQWLGTRGMCCCRLHMLVQMHITDLAKAQKEDLVLSAVLDWLEVQKRMDLRTLLGRACLQQGRADWSGRIDRTSWFIRKPYTCMLNAQGWEWRSVCSFVVPNVHHWITTLNGCHMDAGHQGHDCTLSLLQVCFWWLGMINQMQQSVKTCVHCLQHESGLSKAPLHPIMATTPLDLLHVDFTSIEMTLELNKSPKVANILVFQDHFMKHVLAYVTPNQTAKTASPSFCIRVTSQYLGPQPGSWVTEVLTLWAVSSTKCARSLAWRNCRPHLTTHKLMSWWRDCTKP